MKFKTIFFIAVVLFLNSCQQIVDNYFEQKERDNYVSPYTGTYVGTYSGQDSGTLKIEVSKKNYVNVTRHSEQFNMDETFYGILNGKVFGQTESRTSGFKISGTLSSQTSTYSGTWTMGSLSGTWQIQKK